MTKKIDDYVKVLIEDDLKTGMSQREIVIKRSVSKSFVNKINIKLQKNKPLGRKYGSGRKSLLNDELKRELFFIYDKNHKEFHAKIAQKFTNKFKINVLKQSV
ncbi:hypothetical protein A0H76_2515 [Hepatospora eriocheir]|uniref:HTH psq-type domain-containing protein n=1 Tax=Hepatospora eriocheir TaxID=1081669 RepID=A0A1X0QJY5_9MICR|nr:hypothetical protein A0H76_2515 [Hepatospora eriocheir]